MTKSEIRKLLDPIVWDYNIDSYDLYELALKRKARVDGFTQEKALLRMLERLSWYDLICLFGMDGLKRLLDKEIISRLRIQGQKERYEFIRKVLQGETVSFSGWSPESREKIKHTLLSNRWYSAEQGVF